MRINIIRKLMKIIQYKEILFHTKPSYWINFLKYTYTPKKDKIARYLTVPRQLSFTFLSVDTVGMKAYLNGKKETKSRILERANKICAGHTMVFDIETEAIIGRWSIDPVTGYEWPMVFYDKVRKITPQGTVENRNDIKYPWELSNSHFLVTLAQAYLLSGNEKYFDAFFRYLEDWKKENPIGMGVNWCCTMDVALRAVNIIIAASILNTEIEAFSEAFQPYYGMLYSHMLFIRDNLEFGFVRENHFLSDIVGLKMLAQCFPNDLVAKKYYGYASKYLRNEICYQICPDGVDHEASTCYHGFVLELFMIALATDSTVRQKLTRVEWERLIRMYQFSRLLCSFESYPIIGDNDSGRVTDLNGSGSFRKEIMRFAGNVLGVDCTEKNEYCYLIDDAIQDHELSLQINLELNQYHEGGYVLYNSDDCKLLLHAGSIGRKGKGGHGHNDQTAFVLEVNGQPLIVDPGSMVYERNLELRHKYRSTLSHNCISVARQEQNGISITKPFKMDHDTNASFCVEMSSSEIRIFSRHEGYWKKLNCHCSRTIRIHDHHIIVEDTLEGSYLGVVSARYYFAVGLHVNQEGSTMSIMKGSQKIASVWFGENVSAQVEQDYVSPDYGVAVEADTVIIMGSKNAAKMDIRTEICFSGKEN